MTSLGTPSTEGINSLNLKPMMQIIPPSYMTQVDRALRGFESTSEWADLIAALTKLNR